jgi:hypothetical protein
MSGETVVVKSCMSESGNHEVTLEKSTNGHLMVCVRNISSDVTGVWGCKNDDDATFRYDLAVRTGSFIRDRETILAEIASEQM